MKHYMTSHGRAFEIRPQRLDEPGPGCGQIITTPYGYVLCASPGCGGRHATSFD